jgi:hypothetical protein
MEDKSDSGVKVYAMFDGSDEELKAEERRKKWSTSRVRRASATGWYMKRCQV